MSDKMALRFTSTEFKDFVSAQWYARDQNLKDLGSIPKVWGVPRGGWCVAHILQGLHLAVVVDFPHEADLIVDDIIDSGATEKLHTEMFNKLFWAPVNKLNQHKETGWVEFPWEVGKMSDAKDQVRRILQIIGEDVTRIGLRDTPARVVKSWKELFRGYKTAHKPLVTVFPNGEDGLVYDQIITDEGSFYSQCEHHMIPFFGKYWFGYIPSKDGNILGLSKVARVVDYYSAKLQVQERLGQEILQHIGEALGKTEGMILVLRGQHLCKCMRGVRKEGWMTTSVIQGLFKDSTTKSEFMSMIGLK
jgi:GTP cyclohydrolase I